MEAYGIDWDGPLPQEPIGSTVDVPETQSVLSDQEIQICLIPSLSDCYGIDLYMQTRAYHICQSWQIKQEKNLLHLLDLVQTLLPNPL